MLFIFFAKQVLYKNVIFHIFYFYRKSYVTCQVTATCLSQTLLKSEFGWVHKTGRCKYKTRSVINKRIVVTVESRQSMVL